MVDAKSLLMSISAVVATAAAGAVGGPLAAAEVAAFLASPPGRKLNGALVDQTAEKRGVVLEDFAKGGFVMQPTLGLTGEAGPEFVFPLTPTSKPKRKRSRSARAADKKLSKAFKEANKRMRKQNGQLKKGKTQADVAKLAHRLRKKM
jgi:hypothetical protein